MSTSPLDHDSTFPEKLIPRRYQEEVFVRAQKENIIAALDTGSGKTLISLLLIKWVSALELSKGKAIIFLVPKVALVEQQGDFLTENTPLNVLKLHGALDIDLTDRHQWRKRFSNHDVFVMTAQIFLNLLTHSLWSIEKVSLMIFDECHHARKNHPYNGIMREYFHVAPTCRPKIFGMTASPIWNPKDPTGSLAALEANLDSKVIGVRYHVDELAEHSPKPLEIIKTFSHPLAEYDFPFPSLWMCLQVFDLNVWDDLNIPWYQIEMRYHTTLNNLGPYAASLFLHAELRQHISRIYSDHTQIMDSDTEIGIRSRITTKTQLSREFWDIRDIHLGFNDFFPDLSSPKCTPIPVPLSWCTPKVQTLVELLLAYHTSTFQGIVFVEQRQVAACLTSILPALPQLRGLINTTCLVGQGVGVDGLAKSTPGARSDSVTLFRNRGVNLLIATSVAEEGLDFPACDLVVRFDSLQHMVGYVQSRGRARNKASTFIIMVQKDDIAQLSRYQTLKEKEPEMNQIYRMRHGLDAGVEDVDEYDETDPADLAERERYVVESSGAVLTYDNAVHLLYYLCALIPRDAFTPPHLPKFTGDFDSTLQLPSSIPLPAQDLVYCGPPRRSKKEAKRAAAFMAVRRLHQLDVFDEYLLPVAASRDSESEYSDGQVVHNASQVPIVMDVWVNDPWTTGSKLFRHTVFIDDWPVAALITGTALPPVEVTCSSRRVHTGPGQEMVFDDDEEGWKRNVMRNFTERGLWYRVSTRPLSSPPSLFLVPITPESRLDFDAMEDLTFNPCGYSDWTGINENNYGTLMVMNRNEVGRTLLLKNIRLDLAMMSMPLPGSREEGYSTYFEYFVQKWTRRKWEAVVPTDGPLLETLLLPHYSKGGFDSPESGDISTAPNGYLLPRGCCSWIPMSKEIRTAYELLPPVLYLITGVYRARRARLELGLPPIQDELLMEALTLPSADAGFNNQRLETLGDAVLELCTSVYLFNKYPHRHEGQLTTLRQSVISNRFLLARAKEIGLEVFLTSEKRGIHRWIYTETVEKSRDLHARRMVWRQFPRRSLQDCMEAILGASFATGGIEMALTAGTALGLSFGGILPWGLRYGRNPEALVVPKLFVEIEERLGYTFHRSELLLEAVTHPSFVSSLTTSSYQRLEFLGDALLDLVVIKYLYDKFPTATSHQLAHPKTKAVCAPALAYLTVKLGLHKVMLVNRLELTEAINTYVPLFQAASGEEIVRRGWRYDPPKALSDVFESLMGAVLVDSGYNYEKTAVVVEHVMEDVLASLSPAVRRDPVSDLVTWLAANGCTRVTFEKRQRLRSGIISEGMTVLVHDIVIAGPIVAASLSVAKFFASERAHAVLSDPDAENHLLRVCDCGRAMERDLTDEVGLVTKALDPSRAGDDSEELADVDEVAEILLDVDPAVDDDIRN